MTATTKKVLNRLRDIGCEIHTGSIDPYGTHLPFVAGVAWDFQTAQIALVAAAEPEDLTEVELEDEWRQLLFALSGLRNHLSGSRPPAFGTPILFAVVDEAGIRLLRRLAESLTADYGVFQRVDLNLVPEEVVDDKDKLDFALAPLLPKCREALKSTDKKSGTIGPEDLEIFWRALGGKVEEIAREKLDPSLNPYAEGAAKQITAELIGDGDDAAANVGRPPWRVQQLGIERLRSIATAKVPFGQVTVLSGANGSGKTTVLEALELLWCGSTRRRPEGVKAREYERHLVHDGEGQFAVSGTGRDGAVTKVAEHPAYNLARNALTQEEASALVSKAPKARMQALLETTGLEVPELGLLTGRMFEKHRDRLNKALFDAGIDELKGGLRSSVNHLEEKLEPGFATSAPDWRLLHTAELALEEFTDTYVATSWRQLESVPSEVAALGKIFAAATDDLMAPTPPADEAKKICAELHSKVRKVQSRIPALRALLDATRDSAQASPPVAKASPPIPAHVAATWLAHADGLAEAATSFREDAANLEDSEWRSALSEYAATLEKTARDAPRSRLRDIARSPSPVAPPSAEEVSLRQLEAAGFSRPPSDFSLPRDLVSKLELAMRSYATQLEELLAEVEEHPVWTYAIHYERLLECGARYELARRLRMQDSPTDRATDDLLSSLFESRLAPVLKELVAALVRFDWYFKPITISIDKGKVEAGGVSVDRAGLDIRLLLNAAERSAVGLGWFLALFLMQDAARRKVLVLDDPAGGFDLVNQAGFTSTLRAFVRLLRPSQLVLATHDESFALILEEELQPVDSWPDRLLHLRCKRDENDCSKVEDRTDTSRNVECLATFEAELTALGSLLAQQLDVADLDLVAAVLVVGFGGLVEPEQEVLGG